VSQKDFVQINESNIAQQALITIATSAKLQETENIACEQRSLARSAKNFIEENDISNQDKLTFLFVQQQRILVI
jgi:hypothetical protein